MAGWRELLEAATVALDLPEAGSGGTGFVIAPGVVVTCAHVVSGPGGVRGRIGAGAELTLTVSDDERYRGVNGLDIAFLRFTPQASSAPCALTSPYVEFGDRMWAYGHPRGDYRAGQWAGLEYQGDSRLAFDGAMPMPRGYGTPVGEGFSGSPVVNERTGAVCGMLARSNKAGSAHLVPISEVVARCPVPQAPVAWLGTLTDEQLRAGGFRYPGALLRDYLEAAREAADEHPYAALLTDPGGIPLSTVYVRQEASHTEDRAEESPGHRPAGRGRSAAGRALAEHRHVLFTGGAGSGKSSLLRRLVFTAASAWLGDPGPAPSYVPVLVAADQLLDRPLPEALADALARDLPGLRRSPAPELFENGPMPTVDWLVCVDGLDEVLDPGDRGRVIRLIQRWAREPYLRFVVATRSLVTAEMNRLDELERYALLEFDDDEIEQLAHAWFEALDVEDAGRRAGALAGELRRGRLAEVARNPLYLTMICAVAAVRDLPRNPAGLYARFIGILREKGAQRLVRSDPAVHGITPLLLERVYDALHPVAELRQRGDTRSLLDQVLELLADHDPPHAAARETVLRALTFTGLVRQRGEDLYFLHHTVQEYLAGHALADRLDPKDPEALRTVREAIAAERPNQALFMAARWHEQGSPIAEFLRTVVDGGGWRDLLLCATVLSDELVTDERLTVRFTRAVLKLYDGGDVTVGDLDVDTVLDRLYAVLDAPGLVDVIGDPTVPHWARSGALRHYVRRGAEQAAALAAELADDPDLPADLRVVAATHLARAGDPEAACRRLTALAGDRDHVPETRQEAAVALLALDEAAGTDALALLLRTADFPRLYVENLLRLLPDDLPPQTCVALTDALAGHPLQAEDPHIIDYLSGVLLVRAWPDLLEELCADPTVPLYLRHRATQYFPGHRGHPDQETMRLLCTQVVQSPGSSEDAIAIAVDSIHDAALVERVARDGRLSQYTRLRAVGRLIRLDRPAVAAECLGALSVDRWHLTRVSELLRELGESVRSRQILVDAFEDPRNTVTDRLAHVSSLIGLGASDLLRTPLLRMAEDAGVAVADRLEAVEALGDVDPAVTAGLLHGIAADDAVPGRVRRDAAAQLLKTGDRGAASALLRRIAEDTGVGMLDRIRAVDHLADVDLRAAAETLHRVLDEAGLPDEHLWRLLALADAMTPDVTLRRRLDALIDDVTVPTESLLDIEDESLLQVAVVVPRLRGTLTRIAEDPAAEPWARTRAAGALLGLVPYPRWKDLMAGVSPDPMHVLSLHLTLGGTGSSAYDPAVWQTLAFAQGEEAVIVPVGALAGVDPRAAAAYWTESVERRRPEAVTRLGHLWLLVHDEGTSERVREQLISWVRDSAAPLAERIAAVTTLGASLDESCHTLATEDTTPPELRVAICEHLPASGALNRIPVVRALAADTACPVDVRARAAALLAEDLGEQGRVVLRSLSGPGTTDPEAHLGVAAAWVKLDVGCEAEAAYRRVVEDGHAPARHRVLAADGLMRWRSARNRAREVLRSVLADQDVPVTVRIEAAEKLIAAHEPADAHVGLLRLAPAPEATPEERSRIADLLPADLRAYVERRG
ncbi:trypsin-like peptidase domain-containing protein [Streptomyces sp. NPDC001435]|uniref:trypsin-like peptidase domain-containing protein n=1 Tax=unclassified Streptomyces TaxID=2593676 RepID=UPI0036C580EF